MTDSRILGGGRVLTHGTAVAIGGRAVLLRGPSGAGKSDLALRLIDEGALLVADDQVRVEARDVSTLLDIDVPRVPLKGMSLRLFVGPPAELAGKLEIRGIGILELPFRSMVPLALAVELAPSAAIERLPAPLTFSLLEVAVPMIRVDPYTPSATAKIRASLHYPAMQEPS